MDFESLSLRLKKQNGVLRTVDAIKEGFSKPAFYQFVKKYQLEQVAHGIYLSPNAWVDPMLILHLRCEQVIFSHETALFLHDLTDKEPTGYSVTVKTGYNPSKLKADGATVYSIKQELHSLGMELIITPFGNEVPVYNIERTLCDIVRSRKNIEVQTLRDAMQRYARRRDKNLRRLSQYTKFFHLEKIISPYLEVLL